MSTLLEPLFPVGKGIRLLGVTLSSLDVGPEPHEGRQLRLPLEADAALPSRGDLEG